MLFYDYKNALSAFPVNDLKLWI